MVIFNETTHPSLIPHIYTPTYRLYTPHPTPPHHTFLNWPTQIHTTPSPQTHTQHRHTHRHPYLSTKTTNPQPTPSPAHRSYPPPPPKKQTNKQTHQHIHTPRPTLKLTKEYNLVNAFSSIFSGNLMHFITGINYCFRFYIVHYVTFIANTKRNRAHLK